MTHTHPTPDDVLTGADFGVTSFDEHPTETAHAFLPGETAALCGHPSTRTQAREGGDHAWNDVECGNCRRALAPRYVSTNELYEAVRELDEHDVVRLTLTDGDTINAVVTDPADELTTDEVAMRFVRLTTEPDTVSYLRGPRDDLRLIASEVGAPMVQCSDLLNELTDNPAREICEIDAVATYDPRDGDDPEEREALTHAAEQLAATHDVIADETNSTEERLWNVNYATALREVSYRLRTSDWPLAWVEQKIENNADAYADYPDKVDADPDADRDDYAKASGKRAGYAAAARLLDEYINTDDSDDTGYCGAETTVGGETVTCEKAPGHDGEHTGHVPDDAPGLTWDRHDWDDDSRRLDNPSWQDRFRPDGGTVDG